MKKGNRSEANTTAKSWLGALTYRVAQDSVKVEDFSANLKGMFSSAFLDCNFDDLKNVSVNTDPAQSKTRLMSEARSIKCQKRMRDYLEAYRPYQGVQAKSVNTDSIRTAGDYIIIWAKATGQDTELFMKRVGPRLDLLLGKWQEETSCLGLTDSEALAHPLEASKFVSGMNSVLFQETPADKLQGLAYQMCQKMQRLDTREFLSSLDIPLTQASAMMTAQTTHRIQEALALNPTIKQDILQPEFGALAELGAKSNGLQDNYQKTVEQLREKLSPELAAQGVEVDTELMDKAIAKLDKTDILANLKDAINGNLHRRYVETAAALWNTVCQRVKSIWQFPESESLGTKDNILDLLFRRKTND